MAVDTVLSGDLDFLGNSDIQGELALLLSVSRRLGGGYVGLGRGSIQEMSILTAVSGGVWWPLVLEPL